MSEIVELPGFSGCTPAADDLLVYEHLNRAKVSREVASIGIRLCQLDGRDLCIVLRRSRRAVAEPLLQLEERHWFFGIEELRRNRGAGAMAGDVAANKEANKPRIPAHYTECVLLAAREQCELPDSQLVSHPSKRSTGRHFRVYPLSFLFAT